VVEFRVRIAHNLAAWDIKQRLIMATKTQYPLVLVDGSSYLYRAFHALPPLNTSNGQPTGAIKGVLSMLRKLVEEYRPDNMAVVFDAKGKTFRDDIYPLYKANRPPMPDDLRSQIDPLKDAIRKMGFPLIEIVGVEADDVLGTLALQASELGISTLISTGDKDLAQLVNPHVSLVNTMNGQLLDEAGVMEKFGVEPSNIIDYLALIGDTADNIPGVPKVGPKTAVKWLNLYGDMDGVVSHADEIKGKVGENLRNALEQLPLSYELATIKLDVPLDQTPDQLLLEQPDDAGLLELFKEFEFKAWVDEWNDKLSGEPEGVEPAPAVEVDYQVIDTKEALQVWIEKLKDAELFAFDTETTSLNYMEAELVGVSFAVQAYEAAYVPVAHDYPGAPDQLDRDYVLAALKPILEDQDQLKVGQHLKYDQSILALYDIELKGIQYDTMLESYVLDSTATRHDMDSLALKYLGRSTIHFEDVAGKGVKQLTFNQVDIDIAAPYAAEDADITLQLHETLWGKLQSHPRLVSVFEDIERPLINVLGRIERKGALIDCDMLNKQSARLAKRLAEIEKEAYELAGQPFNLASPKQLGAILFEKLEIPVRKKTPKGQPSTAEAVLQDLAHDYPLPKIILQHRSLSKLKSTYTDKLPLMINQGTKRVHTSYHQAVAATGRLSSSDPNLQNIPIRTEEGRHIREAFIAPEGYLLVAADYSQIELRIMAHLSEDEGLLGAFERGEDVHKATAAEVFSVDVEEVSTNQRRHAKAINFGLIYGMSAFGLAQQLDIGRNEAQLYIDRYFERYPGVHRYMEETRESAAKNGYVETLFGRRLYLPEINSRKVPRRQAAERTAINAPMQGTAADIIKKAMISVDQWLADDRVDAAMIMQVHDELIVEVHESQLEDIKKGLEQHMASAVELKVPLIVDVGVGKNWHEAH